MSVTVLGLVWACDVTPVATRMVLLALADNATDGGFCYPGAAHLAGKTGLSRATVFKAIGELEADGILARRGRYRDNGSRRANAYRINLDGLVARRRVVPAPELDDLELLFAADEGSDPRTRGGRMQRPPVREPEFPPSGSRTTPRPGAGLLEPSLEPSPEPTEDPTQPDHHPDSCVAGDFDLVPPLEIGPSPRAPARMREGGNDQPQSSGMPASPNRSAGTGSQPHSDAEPPAPTRPAVRAGTQRRQDEEGQQPAGPAPDVAASTRSHRRDARSIAGLNRTARTVEAQRLVQTHQDGLPAPLVRSVFVALSTQVTELLADNVPPQTILTALSRLRESRVPHPKTLPMHVQWVLDNDPTAGHRELTMAECDEILGAEEPPALHVDIRQQMTVPELQAWSCRELPLWRERRRTAARARLAERVPA